MTAVVVAIVVLTVAGVPVARALDGSLSRGAAIGAGFMVGCGMVSLVMMALSVSGLGWSFFAVLVLLAVMSVGGEIVRRRSAPSERRAARFDPASVVFDLCTAVSLTGYALFATIARPWEWDFWAIWGLRARADFVARGIDLTFLSNPDVAFSHPDYPPLLSSVYSFTALVRGRWDDRWTGLLFVALAGTLLLVVRDEIRRATGSERFSAFATLALSGVACSPWIGLADGAIVAFGTAGLLVLSRGARDENRRAVLLGGVLLGLAAMTKNEGIALVVSATISLALFRPKRLSWLIAPAVLMSAPWLLLRVTMHLATDVMSGGVFSRVVERLTSPFAFVSTLAAGTPDRSALWLILGIALCFGGRAAFRRNGVMLVAVGVQAFCYVMVYAGTMHDLASHVQSSMARISSHLAAPVGVLCALSIWDMLTNRSASSPAPEGGGTVGEEQGELL